MMKLSVAIGAMILIGIAQQASAAPIPFTATMSGLNEVPPNASTATGLTSLILNGNSLTVNVTFNGLLGGLPSAAHIHCCIAPGQSVGVAVGFPGFPVALSGTYNHVFDLLDPSIYTSGFLTGFGGGTASGAETALINGLMAGTAYSNIHNAQGPGGKIRGLITIVPEPVTLSMFGAGLAG